MAKTVSHTKQSAPSSDSDLFFSQPILNSPYEEPTRHWELDENRQPTQKILPFRRRADFITPIPKPKKVRKGQVQGTLLTDQTAADISDEKQEYQKVLINEIRNHVSAWRKLPKDQWKVTPITARLLEYWRTHEFSGIRPFFCQLEAVETAIWLTEVAPRSKKYKERYLDFFEDASQASNPGLPRLALKMATGSGKTTVMAMLIAWQTLNALRTSSAKFSKGFLIVAPGITIRDRLQVLKPNDPNSYYASRELVPPDMLRDLNQARIVITNFHALKRREKMDVSKGTRAALEGWREQPLQTLESEGEMLQRVMPELVGMKKIVVINDEAHHCYRERPDTDAKLDEELKEVAASDRAEAKKEANERREAARIWISGLEAVQRHMGISRVFDLSATPCFLSGSGYVEGTFFPWMVSDFSLMDAIESGIVKLPRVPVSDNIPNATVPMFRNLWETIKKDMPKKGKNSSYDPLALPMPLQTALEALYGHYKTVFELWQQERISVPPCFIVVCNNTSTSKLVYEYISGFKRQLADGNEHFEQGRLPLFRNFDDNGEPLVRPHTLLIDSVQLERGDVLEADFAEAAKDEIARFKREIMQRGGKLAAELQAGKPLSEAAILREVMNTVGKKDQLGAGIRCVVSVGMLTEGWDASTVTHVLGVRAFGSQLLCEQVIGRALRRQSYELNENRLFDVEYSDILGIPFDFTAKPTIGKPAPPKEMTRVHAVRPERDGQEITFPRVSGYRVELPSEKLQAKFTDESYLTLTQEMTGATDTQNSGIIGESVDLTIQHLDKVRHNTILMYLTRHLLEKFRDGEGVIKYYLYGQLKRITAQWLEKYFKCEGHTFPGQLLYKALADRACEKISDAITNHFKESNPVQVVLDPYNPEGSTRYVNFTTSKRTLWIPDSRKCHLNYIVTDSDWEDELCRVADKQGNHILAYVKNHNLGFEVPYRLAGIPKTYIPDFILLVDDGHGKDDPLHLVVEIKGYRGEDAVQKKAAMEKYWIPGINANGNFGRWAFMEIRRYNAIEADLTDAIAQLRAGKQPQTDEGLLNG